ncbi:hypothetical protein ABK040_004388 [Willaertia magna]
MQTDPTLPVECYCPITQEIMKDPVICVDGHTYERSAIVQWLRIHACSPMTRQPMTAENLVPNIALRNTIEQLLNSNTSVNRNVTTTQTVPPTTPVVHSVEPIELSLNPHMLNSKEALIHISAIPPKEGKRQPSTFICILDVSGSMGQDADDTTAGNENHGFSRLDLVKHSMSTIINVLEPQDQLAIITFSTSAKTILSLTKMNENGRRLASSKLQQIEADGQTNLWDGLRVGLEMTKNPSCLQSNTVLVVLTDGEPNISPPRGEIRTLERHISNNPLNCTIHTFGFGYSLDSKLLSDISRIGSGAYAYIPDCSMVGTIFVNQMSNVLATAVKRAQISFESKDDRIKVVETFGYKNVVNNEINLGAIEYGQTRDIVLKIRSSVDLSEFVDTSLLSVKLKYDGQEVTSDLKDITRTKDMNELYVQHSRLLYIDRILECMEKVKNQNVKESEELLKQTVKEVLSLPSKDDERIKALIKDVQSTNDNEGQVTKALSRVDWYKKWGVHYLPSLLRAHEQQQCNNFKDPGVQLYGGKLFEELQNIADNVFLDLPPPKPSNAGSFNSHTNSYSSFKYSAPVSMSSYYDAGGSCFDGESTILMADGLLKKVCDLRKGDKVKNLNGSKDATVLCVIKSKTTSEIVKLVDLNGMKITPWHPVRINGEWKFPIDIKPTIDVNCGYVYNLVLDEGHVVNINGIECVTLAHGFTDNNVITHQYYGTDKVIKDLKNMKGWLDGYVEMEQYTLSRDPSTGLICSTVQL